jgi:signal peptidase II
VAEPAAEAVSRPAWTLRGKRRFLILAAIITLFDLLSKEVAFDVLEAHQYEWLLGTWLGFTPLENKGIMWGQFAQFSPFLPWLRVVAAIVVTAMMLGTPASARRVQVALALVLGGALGNIYDGFVHDAVRDFVLVDFDFKPFDPFPVFNVADSAICVGVGLLGLGMLLDWVAERRGAAAG